MIPFPFSAVVGMETAKQCLLVSLVCPETCGVLLVGEKGTAKSTVIRSLPSILPDLKVITLPLCATEDRVLGSISIEHTMRDGLRVFEPGLLKRAHGHVLYIDEANLLPKQIVSSILEAASSGNVRIEREGVSCSYESRFVLAATMNPEEGELDPELLDRFGMMVTVSGERDIGRRISIIRNYLDYEASPKRFRMRFLEEERKLSDMVSKAAALLPRVTISDGLIETIAGLSEEAETCGHRAELVLTHASRALAALKGRSVVHLDDVREMAGPVLAHRQRKAEVTQKHPTTGRSEVAHHVDAAQDGRPPVERYPQHKREYLSCFKDSRRDDEETIFPIDDTDRYALSMPKAFIMRRKMKWNSGSGNDAGNYAYRGSRYIRFSMSGDTVGTVALDATLRAAAPFQNTRMRNGLAFTILPSDIRRKLFEQRTSTLILFAVDGSGSMGANRRMAAAKGAILSLLKEAYLVRSSIGMLVFRKEGADMVVPPTKSADLAYRLLRDLPIGGKTPLGLGLLRAMEYVKAMRFADKYSSHHIVLVSDGRGNVSCSDKDPMEEALAAARLILKERIPITVVDTECGWMRTGSARKLCAAAGGTYVSLDSDDQGSVADILRLRIGGMK